MSDAVGGRFSRWSQRKAAARRGGALPAEPADAVAPVRPAEATTGEPRRATGTVPDDAGRREQTGRSASDGRRIAGLPPIEELTFQSDYTGFMAKGVPEALKRAALRKLWMSDPVLANLDGLCDYNEDHHLIDTSITLDQTSYKVGKGYFDEVEEKARGTRRCAARLRPAKVPNAIPIRRERRASRGNGRNTGRK